MASSLALFFVIFFIVICDPSNVVSKVFMVLLEEEPVVSLMSKEASFSENRSASMYKERMSVKHDILLESVLQRGSYTKLYSYTHLINGFVIHVPTEEVISALKDAKEVRAVFEDIKLKKLTTHTPDFLQIPNNIWPTLGGANSSGEGVVIGFIDTGINPHHNSFTRNSSSTIVKHSKFKGNCTTGKQFPATACNGKIVGARYFASGAIASGELNVTRDYTSPFDADGHGSHTASTAAGNHRIPVIVNGFNYGYASGMAPGASIAVYKALYTFGGYMSDVVAAVDQAVEDGVDILSLSVGPSSVPKGPSAFLNVLEVALLFATKAGVLVVQAAGNDGPSSSSILSFSPWITSVAASTTDRRYSNSISLGNGQTFSGSGLAPPTSGLVNYSIAAAADVSQTNITNRSVYSCQHPEFFIQSMVRGKIIICTYTFDFEFETASISTVANTIQKIGAAGFIITVDPGTDSAQMTGTMMTLEVPGIILTDMEASRSLWEYYNSHTIRSRNGEPVFFAAYARILDGRIPTYSMQAPVVASYSSRGPDLNNALLQTADVLKPNLMAPGSSIWAAWSPNSEGDPYSKGQNFALVSGTSMSTPHIAGVAALIKQKHPNWGPAAIMSAMMTTANVYDNAGAPILAQSKNSQTHATPFDYGSGFINPTRTLDPGLIFDTNFSDYIHFLCSVPGVDDTSVKRVVGVTCPSSDVKKSCSDLNTASITISNLVGTRKVLRRVVNVGSENEFYRVVIKEPMGVNVSVTPQAFSIQVNGSRHIKLALQATRVTNAYTFGEMVLQSRLHNVRVPITVFVGNDAIRS